LGKVPDFARQGSHNIRGVRRLPDPFPFCMPSRKSFASLKAPSIVVSAKYISLCNWIIGILVAVVLPVAWRIAAFELMHVHICMQTERS